MVKPKPRQPEPGQESVWEYPRPPRLERADKHIQVVFSDVVVADSRWVWRVLETSHPPVYYIPPDSVNMHYLRDVGGGSWCEWKGRATYYDVVVDDRIARRAAWAYHQPSASFAQIKDHIAFYAWAMDACLVNGEKARPQPGQFYGGWITADIAGPFKGEPGTSGW